MQISDHKYVSYFLIFLSATAYFYLGYFLERQQFYLLFGLYTLVFISFIYFTKFLNNSKILFSLGLVFRLIFLFSTPLLSQDFYRFIWDGRLIFLGINPYQYLPIDIINTVATFSDAHFIFSKMGELSANHFSNYPPVNQFLFSLAALFSGKSILGSVLVFRIIIILADIGVYYFGKKILQQLNLNPNNIFLYFLNPLVILELSGNLHFEGVMLFFLVAGYYSLLKKNWVLSAVFISLSISIKLLPLLLLPLFWQMLKFKKSVAFYLIIIGLNILFFLPFVNGQLINNYLDTISLWFTNFEFNASFYYIVRAIGYYFKGYNIIGTVGRYTPIIAVLMILFYSFFKKNISLSLIIQHSLFVLTIYLFLSTTVHPWYVINLVLLSVFTNYKYAIIWSFTIILSYFAYSSPIFHENLFFIFIEYILVIGWLFIEISNNQSIKNKLKLIF